MTQDDVDFQNFLKLIDRRGARRFLSEPMPPTGFSDLGEPEDLDTRLAQAMEQDQ